MELLGHMVVLFLVCWERCILLDKEMAPYSSILAWEIPWTEEPVELQSMGWQRVGLYWEAKRTHPMLFSTVAALSTFPPTAEEGPKELWLLWADFRQSPGSVRSWKNAGFYHIHKVGRNLFLRKWRGVKLLYFVYASICVSFAWRISM